MVQAKLLLEQLTIQMPPGIGQRHSITIDEAGNLVVTLMMGDVYVPATLEEGDYDKGIYDLVAELVFVANECVSARQTSSNSHL